MTRPPIAYVLKMYPRLSETFILNEILELERQGQPVHIFSLRPSDDARHHADVTRVRARVTTVPQQTWRLSRPMLRAHLELLEDASTAPRSRHRVVQSSRAGGR
jgi:hypothetical protein